MVGREFPSRDLKQGSLIASRQSRPFASMIVIPGRGDLSLGVQAMRKGAVDCPEKPIENASSLWVVKCGVELFRLNRAHLLAANGIGGAGENFNQREREVFALITSGQLNKQVGAELGSSEPEVKKHRSPVINKMGAASLAELVRMAETLRIHSRGSLPEEASDCHL